jgi:hypothetical protein
MRYFWATYRANLALAPIYALFVAWSIWRWARSVPNNHESWRFRAATIGLFFGVGSAVLLGTFYAHLWITGTLIAHGSILWLIYYIGEYSADAGFILALAGRGELRISAVVVNLVLVFQWYGMMIVGLRGEAMLSMAMYVCVAIIACVWLFGRSRIYPHFRTDNRV